MTSEKTKGKLIVFEGIDGTGKTTHMEAFVEYLRSKGFKVCNFREPGGTSVGEKIRPILLQDTPTPMTELLLFAASRMQILETVVRPMLADGWIVILDRYMDSTFAYQAFGRGLAGAVALVEKFWEEDQPDYSLYFNVDLDIAERRTQVRRSQDRDRLDKEGREFREKLDAGYRYRMINRVEAGQHVTHIDANRSMEDVFEQLTTWAEVHFIPANQHLKGTA
jgi:dTMP kinase